MKISLLFAAVIATSQAAPSALHEVHERRDPGLYSQWDDVWNRVRSETIDKRSVLPVSIGLTQRNLEMGENYILDVSDPRSSNYGKHWTPEKIIETFSSSHESVAVVKAWLIDSGISEDRISLSNGRTWFRMNLTIAETELLLKTEYEIFEHSSSGKRSISCPMYSIPIAIRSHIDYITPTVESTIVVRGEKADTKSRAREHFAKYKRATGVSKPSLPHSSTLIVRDAGASQFSWDVGSCDEYLTRACLQALYNIPNGTLALSSFGVVSLSPQVFIEYDLQIYVYNLVSVDDWDQEPTVYVMSDATFDPDSTDGGLNAAGRGNANVQFAVGLLYPQQITWYSMASIDVFLDAIDAAYCVTMPGMYCGTVPRTSVMSLDWGENEISGNAAQARQCNEFMKLGLLGTTVIAASGIYGVSGIAAGPCLAFAITWPSACPYVTSVGGTQMPSPATFTNPETAWAGSGGGLSLSVPVPSWQISAMSNYAVNHTPSYSSSQYQSSFTTRGVPDISASAVNALFVLQAAWYLGSGTAFSAPTVGSLITLINNQRVAASKSTVGFINPVLYAHPATMNDIVVGSNPGCGTAGFSAVPGWDPVTGLGTPDYVRLLAVFMALP